jgi:hypothetical protein
MPTTRTSLPNFACAFVASVVAAGVFVAIGTPGAIGTEISRVEVGIAACDSYFTAFEACVREKVSGPERDEFLDGIRVGSAALKRMTTSPAKPDVAAICAMTQPDVFAMLSSKYGCALP